MKNIINNLLFLWYMIIIYIVNIKYINYIDKKLINIMIYIIFNRFGGCLSEIIEIN